MPRRRRKRKIVISQGEQVCGLCLEKLELEARSQFRISALPRYRYDYQFMYQDRQYLFEFDGVQHFNYTPWFHRSMRSFYNQRRRDLLKSAVAVMQGYYLIRIAYQDLVDLEFHIRKALVGESRVYFSSPETYTYLRTTKIPRKWMKNYLVISS